MLRMGVAANVRGRRVAPARGAGRHLSVGLLALRDVLLYLAERRIECYRLPDTIAGCLDAPDAGELRRQIEECDGLLAEVRSQARGARLTMHLPLHAALGSPDESVAARAAAAIEARALLLEALGGPASTLVVHIGGAHGDRAAALHRFAARHERLSAAARARIAVEPDEGRFSLGDLLRLHRLTGAPVVLDALHHQINNPERVPMGAALGLALATWPRGTRPKIHYSTQRTEGHALAARGGQAQALLPPRLGQHADYINPFEFISLIEAARGLPPFDIMLEAKAGDLALLRLREDIQRLAPGLRAVVQ